MAVSGDTGESFCFNDSPKNKTINIFEISFYIIHDLNQLELDPVIAGVKSCCWR